MTRMLRCAEANKPVGLGIIAAMITDAAETNPIKIDSACILRSGQSECYTCVPGEGFLSRCFLCGKRLHGIDIYMYREKAFCSAECRSSQIAKDEHAVNCLPKAFKSGSPCSASLFFVPGITEIY
ncbi:hypothetical protein LUZ62_068693 [Rhynchospora pubera]|uniref:FLZ-type domain-containing protein n=1 Tax=Rhynchospora pubera TaxID=906938 RepID=A0AAV8CW37_9POAL|nr:hypothetical protein LUZ62_068693 [Rhynchospora pubera]